MLQKFSNSVNLYGFTILRNGVKYDYSFKESFTSLSNLVKETYVALDAGEDSSLEEVSKLEKMKIVPTVWDMNLKKGLVLSVETNKALEALRKDHGADDNAWGIYLQADEVLHEEDYELLIKDIETANATGCDVVSFRYLHFWQTHHHIVLSKKWYPHEIRAVKLKSNVESWGDAQGFRNYSKKFFTEARIYHYGHTRDQTSYKNKMRDMGKMYHEDQDLEARLQKGLDDAKKIQCALYFGTHPKVMKDRIFKMGDIWELKQVPEVAIVGNPEKYDKSLINSINAEKVSWYKSASEVPAHLKKQMVIAEPGFMDFILRRATTPIKMKSKQAQLWSDSFKLIMQLSSKKIGLRHG